jgi:hypothetical protein
MTVNCPSCNGQIEIPFSTASQAPTISGLMPQKLFAVPTKLPFLKSHRKEILEAKVSEFVSLGPIDQSIEAKLQDFAVALGLEKTGRNGGLNWTLHDRIRTDQKTNGIFVRFDRLRSR